MRLPGLLAACLMLPLLAVASSAESITVLPKQVTLTGVEARHRLLVHTLTGVEIGEQLQKVEFTSSDESVAAVDGGVIEPMSNGRATITAKAGNATATVEVEVVGMERPSAWSFRHHVLPVLAKKGCNSGACHGALAGKGGFKLSLRGYDPASDHHVITRQARGRRIEAADPGRSLILTKPSGALPHKGGLRFDVNDLEYRILSEWIASGAAGPNDADPKLERVEILPELAVLKPGSKENVVVRAHYSDGRVEDVTRWVKFSSANEAVALVDDNGLVNVIGYGEGAVTAWFSSKIAIARVTSPYDNKVDPQVYVKAPKRNFIDELVLQQLQRMNLEPSPAANDEEFIRRVYLDTIGTLPTKEEVLAFLADGAADKRDKLIASLLARSEFIDYWTYKWSDMLLINGQLLRPNAVKTYYQWLHQRVKANTPWDVLVREVVTAQGNTFENGATNFYSLHQDPETMSENVSQAFLGLSIGCAKCHNHPLEKWTNNQYYAMANLFARVRAKGWGGDVRGGDGARTVYVADKGDLIQPLTGKPQPPTPLDGEAIPFDDPSDRRVVLAKWLTAPENPYFSRAIANRIWANYFGVGLVEPIDDMRVSNPASNEELLAAAARFLVENKMDVKSLMRVILQSHTYQRSSLPLPTNKAEDRFYSRYYPRRLMAEVLLDAVSQVAQVPTEFNEVAYPSEKHKTDFYPKGTRAIQLYDSAVASYFLKTFGRNQRNITCECERSDEPSMVQVLHISNGDTVNEKLRAKGGRIDKLVEQKLADEQMIEEAYLVSLARKPTQAEREQLLAMMKEDPQADKRSLIEDVFWSILSSREFIFNH